ncbi:hypothetical protein I7I53_08878 [Histoplasma capsulatum var. duboisii H88]|uniref:Uncharacterized protein n=1 Tax=Ajellomyces capsulatus (strain H88) TaxID=544711 RepID=A0A8A1L3X8_AJEC8|nr:hypothetical protein I7I53_08878 [Histoplasma capsulatum var. duboisii H88]
MWFPTISTWLPKTAEGGGLDLVPPLQDWGYKTVASKLRRRKSKSMPICASFSMKVKPASQTHPFASAYFGV